MAATSSVEGVERKAVEWTTLPLQDGHVRVSSATVVVPQGLQVVSNFVTPVEAQQLLDVVDQGDMVWEGFEQRRRVQRFPLEAYEENDLLPVLLTNLVQRVVKKVGLTPQEISIEEYPRNQLHRNFNTNQSTVTTFESHCFCQCPKNKCTCFVAILPIGNSVIANINRPKRRSADCWDLYSPNHGAGLLLNKYDLCVKTEEFLWEWRSRISSAGSDAGDNEQNQEDRFVLVRFQRLPQASPASHTIGYSEFGYLPRPEDCNRRIEPMPPLEEILTVVVTTSPIKSNPSTELLERVFQTFFHGGYDFAIKCKKIIVCDGCRQRDESVSKRHNNIKQAMRNGIVDSSQLESYAQFKMSLRRLCDEASENSPFLNTTVEELSSRHGYGFALRHALRECVLTPYVIVIQHDRTFMRPTPIAEALRAMWHHQNIKYVGMSMRSNLMYRDQFLGKYGKSYMHAMRSCILRPPELAVPENLYGPNSQSTHQMDYAGQEKLRENIQALIDTYKSSQQNLDHLEWIKSNPLPPFTWQLSLTPTFFWFDNVHICETAHYRDFVFDPRYKMVVRGGFVEDKLSPVIKKTVERLGLVEGHARFGCYLLDDHSGMFFTGHLDGGTYITRVEREALTSKLGLNGTPKL